MSISKKCWYMLFGMLAFIGLMGFFGIHPLYIYDFDDWLYISFSRRTLPSVKQWNPTKILPETLLPLCAEISVRFVMPFTGDYIGSMGIVFAVVTSMFIIGYIIAFGLHLSSEYGVRTVETMNYYLRGIFHTVNVNTF